MKNRRPWIHTQNSKKLVVLTASQFAILLFSIFVGSQKLGRIESTLEYPIHIRKTQYFWHHQLRKSEIFTFFRFLQTPFCRENITIPQNSKYQEALSPEFNNLYVFKSFAIVSQQQARQALAHHTIPCPSQVKKQCTKARNFMDCFSMKLR